MSASAGEVGGARVSDPAVLARWRPLSGSVNRVFLYALLLFCVFAPTFHNILDTRGAILVNGGLLLLSGCLLLTNGLRVPLLDRREMWGFGLVVASLAYYLLAISFATAFFSPGVIFRDTFELHKPVLHFLAFCTPLLTLRRETDLADLDRVLDLVFVGIVAMSVVQFLEVTGVAYLYTDAQNAGRGRLTAPFGNPYDYAFALTFFFYLYLFRYLMNGELWGGPFALLALTAVVLSQSRTSVITVAGSLAVLVPLALLLAYAPTFFRLRIPAAALRFGFLLTGLLVLGVLAYNRFKEELAYLIYGIRMLLVHGRQSSLDVRIQQIGLIMERAQDTGWIALFGNGVSKGTMHLLESGYAFFLFRYGLVGFLLIFLVSLLVGIAWSAWSLLRRVGRRHMMAAALVWFLSLFVASSGNAFTEMPKLSFLYYFLIGLSIRFPALAEAEGTGAGETAHVSADTPACGTHVGGRGS